MVTESCVFVQALCGTIIYVPTLSGERIPLNLMNEVVKTTTIKRIRGHGLPFPKEPGRMGDLIVCFDIKLPDIITQGDWLRN